MYQVEYLLLVDGNKTSCDTVESFLHLLQSNSEIQVSENSSTIKYKGIKVGLHIIKGNIALDKIPSEAPTIYFDITLSCKAKKDLVVFEELLRSVRTVTNPVLVNPTALQVLRNDMSAYYASQAYPIISSTENLMRKLITKFMHINVGLEWTEERIPDDVQKTVNSSNSDSTYLYNVDFIQLRDILLSETYTKDRDALIKELKTSTRANFKREQIDALIPMSNWEKFFSNQVNCSAEELSSLWARLYEYRNKVAHNKSFRAEDLKKCNELVKRLDLILNEAINKLDDIHIDQDEASGIIDDVVSRASKDDSMITRAFLFEWQRLQTAVFKLTTPLQPTKKESPRTFRSDLRLLIVSGDINYQQFRKILDLSRVRNQMVHSINASKELEKLEQSINELSDINRILEKKTAKASDKK